MKTILIAILAVLSVALAGVLGYQKLTQPIETTPIVVNQPVATTSNETAGWQTYRNNEVGIEFKYPGSIGEIENATTIDKQIGPIYVKAYSNTWWGPYEINPEISIDEIRQKNDVNRQKNEKYYKDLFFLIKDYSQNQECNGLDIFVPIYGRSNIGQSCRVVISDSGTKIITGFYRNIHGSPPKIAFFITDKYVIELGFGYYTFEEENQITSSRSSYLNSDSFIQEIYSGKYEKITKQIDVFDQILKTVEVIK